MNLKEVPEKLESPDYYMEECGYDIRLAIKKLHDFLDTVGLAGFALIYVDNSEYEHLKNLDDTKKNILRRLNINNAILWCNNCFDILLQSVWFMYRVWEKYNSSGSLYRPNMCNRADITRNTTNWVTVAELSCDYWKLKRYLEVHKMQDKNNDLLNALQGFHDNYIYDIPNKQPYLIRALANRIKHMESLKLKEFETKTSFKLSIANVKIKDTDLELKDVVIDLKNNPNYGFEMENYFFELNNPSVCGKIKHVYTQDYYVDIEYDNGDFFNGKDLLNVAYGMDDIARELEVFYNNIIDLYNEVFKCFSDKIQKIPNNSDVNRNIKEITIHQAPLLEHLPDEEERA